MTNSRGQSTNALFGFIRSILKLKNDFQCDHWVSVFDGPQNQKSREAIYTDYKAHRASMPPDLSYQIEWGRLWCDLYGIPNLSVPGVEADDTIGSIALWAKEGGYDVYVCTSDKDLAQIVQENISLLNTFKENQILDPAGVEAQFGVKPHQIVDYLSITGDSSDNVPGISGFGPKTAADLLRLHGTLDALYENPSLITGKKREVFIAEKENALMSRKLVTLHTDVDFPKDSTFFEHGQLKGEELKNFYLEMGFNTLLKELEPPKPVDNTVHYHLVNSEEELQSLLSRLKQEISIAFDTETDSEDPIKARVCGISFSFKEKEAFYIPLNGNLGRELVLNLLKPIFEDPSKQFFGHNAKYDLHVLQNEGIEVATIAFDTMLASYILNAHERRHNLDLLTLTLFNHTKIPIEQLIGKGKNQITMFEVPLETISTYACEDADYTFRLKNLFEKELKERGLETLFYQTEIPLIRVLNRMERKGMWIDQPFLKGLGSQVESELNHLTNQIFVMAGETFNLNSPKQLSQILFEKMGIKPPRKTKSGHSTDADVLEELKQEHPIAQKLIEYRALEKLRSTYIEKLPTQVFEKDQRIHSTFNQTVAATGRLSSQDPNLQNIPVRSEMGKKIREAFKPEKEGWSYLAADYSQIELRLLAHLSEDKTLIDAFLSNQDIHTATAASIFGVDIASVTPEMRQRAKAVNFGIIYGQGDFGLAQELGISRLEASEIIHLYFKKYERVHNYIQEQKELARRTGRARTLTGRERLLPEITSKNIQIRNAAERLAVNTPLQGTQADLIKMAMIVIDQKIREKNLKGFMVLQIHDELLFEIPDSELPIFKELVQFHMQNIFQLKVPLNVDIHTGKNWKEC